MSRVGSGRGKRAVQHIMDRVESDVDQLKKLVGRVGSGRVIAGRVRSRQLETFAGQVGSGWVTQPDATGEVVDLTREEQPRLCLSRTQ